jgi:NADH-quinone oxidoreductase subunit N
MNSAPLFPLLAPLVLVLAGGLAALAAEPFLGREAKHRILPWIAVVFLVAAGLAAWCAPVGHLHGLLVIDEARRWLMLAVIAATAISLGGMQQSLDRDRFPGGEAYALACVAATGVLGMVMAADSMALFVGVEIAAISIYALVGLRRQDAAAAEGLFKYLVMGAVFSAIYLYGAALHYGATGGTRFGGAFAAERQTLALLGNALMIVGLVFKVGSVPFHGWAPDAYTGAPVAVTGLMGAIIKVGGFAGLGALWLGLAATGSAGPVALDAPTTVVPAARALMQPLALLIAVSAVLSLVVGNCGALKQTSVRRLVAYSSIAHAGYMLLAFVLPGAGAAIDLRPLWFYAVGYALATAGALAALSTLANTDDRGDDLTALHGRGRAAPLQGVALTIFLASFAGLPPTLGFLGKFAVLGQLTANGGWLMALTALVFAVIGAAAYVRLVVQLWAAQPKDTVATGTLLLARWGVALSAILVVALLAYPRPLPQRADPAPVAAALPVAPPAEVPTP